MYNTQPIIACDGDDDDGDLWGLPGVECGDDDVFYADIVDANEKEEEEQWYQVADHFYSNVTRKI